MFILLFIVLRHQYHCSAVRSVYSSNCKASSSSEPQTFCHSVLVFFTTCVCQAEARRLIGLFNEARHKCMPVYVRFWSNFRRTSLKDHSSSLSAATMTLETVDIILLLWNIRPHNPQFSRSIIYNVITVGLTGHSSCAPPCVASIKFWFVNDCLFFAGRMESELYSLSLYSHWLTPATDVWTVIGLHCRPAPCHTGNGLFFSPNGCNLLFFLKIAPDHFQLHSWAHEQERQNDMDHSRVPQSALFTVCVHGAASAIFSNIITLS